MAVLSAVLCVGLTHGHYSPLSARGARTSPCGQWIVAARPSLPRAAAVAVETEKYSREARIKEELSSPLRLPRFFIYAGMLLGGSASGYIAFTRLLASLAGMPNVQDRGEVAVNLAIDLGAVALAVLLLMRDLRARDENLDRITILLAEQAKKRRAKSSGVAEADDTDLFVGR